MPESKGIPFDAPLYRLDDERGSVLIDGQSVTAVFTIASDIKRLLPKGLVPAADPPIGVVVIAHYGLSNFGPYLEQYSGIQVRDPSGETGYYIPYIYVTNDVAMAAGREHLGAPKKLAHIELVRDGDLIQGTLERPAGKRLLTLTAQPNTRISTAMRQMLPTRTNAYAVRHLPPIGEAGEGGVTQLVKWRSERTFRRDEKGEEVIFSGLVSLTYDFPSVIDPVHNLTIGQIVLGVYEEFDTKLQAVGLLSGT